MVLIPLQMIFVPLLLVYALICEQHKASNTQVTWDSERFKVKRRKETVVELNWKDIVVAAPFGALFYWTTYKGTFITASLSGRNFRAAAETYLGAKYHAPSRDAKNYPQLKERTIDLLPGSIFLRSVMPGSARVAVIMSSISLALALLLSFKFSADSLMHESILVHGEGVQAKVTQANKVSGKGGGYYAIHYDYVANGQPHRGKDTLPFYRYDNQKFVHIFFDRTAPERSLIDLPTFANTKFTLACAVLYPALAAAVLLWTIRFQKRIAQIVATPLKHVSWDTL